MDSTGRTLAKWTGLLSLSWVALVGAMLWALDYPRLAWGYAAGVGLGGLLLAGMFLVVYVLLAPPGPAGPPRSKYPVLAFQLLKYLLALALLYLLISRWQVDLLGLGAGIVTPVAVAALVTICRPRRAGRADSP